MTPNHTLEKTQFVQQMMLKKLDIHMWNIEIRSLFLTLDLNVRPTSFKLQEENLRETLQDQGIDIDFLNMNPVAQEKQVTASIDKWNCIKFGSFCTAK
jgi:hypothetical protein